MPLSEIEKWNLGYGSALITSLDEMAEYISYYPRLTIVTSGGFDPIHPGHQSVFCDIMGRYAFKKTTQYDEVSLVVLVNSDEFLEKKKGIAFQDVKTRCQVVSFCKCVDYVVPFFPTDPDDMTVSEALERLKPTIFAKGGDRTGPDNIPEWEVCQKNNIEVITSLGSNKDWSSSDMLDSYYLRRTNEV